MKTALIASVATVLIPTFGVLSRTSSPADATPVELAVGVRPLAEEGHHADVRDIVGRAKISLRDAIGKALAAHPGRAVEADLEGEIDDEQVDVFFEVLILDGEGELIEVRLDPQTGAVRESEEAEGDEDEIPEFQAALRHSEHDLQKLVEMAESYVKGVAVSASLEYDDGAPRCDVAFVHTRYVIEVEVEALAGHLVEIELRPEATGEEHGDEEHDGDDDEDHEGMAEHEGEEGHEAEEAGEARQGKEACEEHERAESREKAGKGGIR